MHEWRPSAHVEAAGDDKNAHMNHFRLNQMKFKSQKKNKNNLHCRHVFLEKALVGVRMEQASLSNGSISNNDNLSRCLRHVFIKLESSENPKIEEKIFNIVTTE